MRSPHCTLRFQDVFPPRPHSLRAWHAPDRLHLTYNARGAFYQLLRSLPKEAGGTVLLPAFHCTALAEPAVRAGYLIEFYRVRPDFSVDVDDLRRKMSSSVAALVAIHYFGFPADLEPFLELGRRHGSYVVEDCAHSFLTRVNGTCVGHCGDFALFSYYKFAPGLAGGGLGINRRDFTAPLSAVTVPLRERLVITKRLFEQALANSPIHPVSRLLLRWERRRVAGRRSVPAADSPSNFVDGPYLFREDLALAAMPWLCQFVLESCSWEEIASARQRNYRLLSEAIHDCAGLRRVFPALPSGVCPWAFPVLLEDRHLHEQKLRSLDVPLFTFGEVLHPLLGASRDQAREDAEDLSRRLLLLPVHAQIDADHICSFADTVNRYARELEQHAGGTSTKSLAEDPHPARAFQSSMR